MLTSTNDKATRLADQASAISIAAPQVVMHRMLQMASSGSPPSARDQKELQLMSQEKLDVFWESWHAMAWQVLKANQMLMMTMIRPLWDAKPGEWPVLHFSSKALQDAALGVMSKGIAPIRRRAVANAERLGNDSWR